ncbi:MAG: ArsR/SmtB family transcription factor [Anaerocolumna sp.]
MEKRLQILQTPDLVGEAYILLYFWINNDDMETSFQRNLDLQGEETEGNREHFQLLRSMYCDITEYFTTQKKRIEYLFKARNGDFSTYAGLSILWNFHEYHNQLISYKEMFGQMKEETKVKSYAKLIDCEQSANTSEKNLKSLADLIAFLEDSSFDKDAKWEAIKIYHNQESYYNEVITLLSEVVELFKNKHINTITTLSETFCNYWHAYHKKNDIIKIIKEKMGFTWTESGAGTIIIPHLFQPFRVSLSTDEDLPTKPDVLRIGIMLNEHFILTNRSIKKEDIINIGKLLSDKSKVDILEYVSKKPCYGKELANELQLTTATISHHVNALLKERLLKAEVSANKVYYSLNRETLAIYLDNMKAYFL